MSSRKTTSITLSTWAKRKLDEYAGRENRSASNFLENLIRNEFVDLGVSQCKPKPSK